MVERPCSRGERTEQEPRDRARPLARGRRHEAPRHVRAESPSRWAFHRFFEHIEVDEAWAGSVREADSRGTVVYVLRNLSFVDFLALDYLTKQPRAPAGPLRERPRALGPRADGARLALRARSRRSRPTPSDLRRAVAGGRFGGALPEAPADAPRAAASARAHRGRRVPPHAPRGAARGAAPILLVPQVFVWSKHGDEAQHNAVDALLGPREWPGKIRTVAQFLTNWRHVTLRAGEPVDVQAFLASRARQERQSRRRRARPPPHVHAPPPARARASRGRRADAEARRSPARSGRPQPAPPEDHPRHGRRRRDRAARPRAQRALAMLREIEAELDPNAVARARRVVRADRRADVLGLEVDRRASSACARPRRTARSSSCRATNRTSTTSSCRASSIAHHCRSRSSPRATTSPSSRSARSSGAPARSSSAAASGRSPLRRRRRRLHAPAPERRLAARVLPRRRPLAHGQAPAAEARPPLDRRRRGARRRRDARRSSARSRSATSASSKRSVRAASSPAARRRRRTCAASSTRRERLGQRYGRLNVQFGELLTLDGVLAELDDARHARRSRRRGAARSSRASRTA